MCLSVCLANCGPLDPPLNGSLGSYSRTTEGANVTFQCDRFFFPDGVFSAVCTSESVWDPLPARLNCTPDGKLS